MKLSELFSGTGSIGEVFKNENWEVISLDVSKKSYASICCDIMFWDYKIYPPNYFNVIWASPVCTHCSIARTKAKTPRNFEWADGLVLKTLEIIEQFKPDVWFIENPQSGLLKTRPFMKNINYIDVDYCSYCLWGYRKRTRIWTNSNLKNKFCSGIGKCPNMDGRHHIKTAQRGTRTLQGERLTNTNSLNQLYKIPPLLCQDIFNICIT